MSTDLLVEARLKAHPHFGVYLRHLECLLILFLCMDEGAKDVLVLVPVLVPQQDLLEVLSVLVPDVISAGDGVLLP